jgi:hypothetical protein
MVAVTNLAASGAHIILFTTGRGTPLSAPIPTLKIATNSALAKKKPHWIDFNAGVLLEGADMGKEGEKLFELTAEQEKASKQARNSGTRKAPTVYKLDNADGKRSRKENPTKAGIIAEIAKFLVENSENACENVEITNKERQIAFKIGENSYELTLVQKRKPKN